MTEVPNRILLIACALSVLFAPACGDNPVVEDGDALTAEPDAPTPPKQGAPQELTPPKQATPDVDEPDAQVPPVVPSDGRPNVLVVLLDDLGYSDFGAYGSEIRTPSIDGLAQGGTRFRNYYVTPRCSPTRASLLTGQYTHQVATDPGASLPALRSDNNATVPELLSAAGYRTYMAGKWHLGNADDQVPRMRGFDHAFGFGPRAAGVDGSKWDKNQYGFVSKNNEIPTRTYGDAPKDFYQSRAIGDYALDYLSHHTAKNDGAPFFMYLAFNDPHFPIQADRAMVERVPAGGQSYLDIYAKGWKEARSARYQRMLDQGVIDSSFGLSPTEAFGQPVQSIPSWATLSGDQQADLVRKMALYAASIEAVDEAVGRVVARLKATGQFENTLILVQSDNGGTFEGGVVGTAFDKPDPLTGQQLLDMGQPGVPDHVQVGGGWANVQNTPFRLFKQYTHGGGVRSPLVVSWPAKISAPGGWTNQVAHVVDIVPTILDAAAVEHPASFEGHPILPLEGRSLMSSLADPAAAQARTLGFEHEGNRAWIDGNYKLVVRQRAGDLIELYDLSSDPSELADLSAAQPTRTKDMVNAWNAWATRVSVPADRQIFR
ncbi:MAG: arylsulfatase [Myxococcales bacterium]